MRALPGKILQITSYMRGFLVVVGSLGDCLECCVLVLDVYELDDEEEGLGP